MDKTNYEKFVTDLIGIRCLVLFKEDWESFHHYILTEFENNADYYVKDSLSDFDDNENHSYMAEMPKVHIRNGDSRDLYENVLSPDSILDGKVYRSVHYIIKYRGVYLEIQVRTLFEEGWGEIDHAITYPYYQDDKILKEYTEMLNRLSGLADEMGSFFHRLKTLEIESNEDERISSNDEHMPKKGDQQMSALEAKDKKDEKQPRSKVKSMVTPADCLQSVLDE